VRRRTEGGLMAKIFTADFVARHQAKYGRSNVSFTGVPVAQPAPDLVPVATPGGLKPAPSSPRGAGSKYRNEAEGGFDSKKEARRHRQLRILEAACAIRDLEHHKRFLLVPEQRDASGALIERAVYYEADFTYVDVPSGEFIAEDTKGVRTPLYILKRKLMLFVHRIRVRET
jgi:hypothetical protein